MIACELEGGLMKVEPELRALYKKGGGWREFFDLLSSYTNRRSQLSAENAEQYSGLAYETVVGFLKQLAALGVGTFRFGRHGKKTRIIWKYSPRSVGEVAQGKRAELEAYSPDGEAEGPDDPAEPSDDEPDEPPKPAAPQASLSQLIQAAKRDLAAKLGIEPEKIEITIRH